MLPIPTPVSPYSSTLAPLRISPAFYQVGGFTTIREKCGTVEMKCLDCPRSITRKSKTGRCRKCAAKRAGCDPELKALRSANRKIWAAHHPDAAAKQRLIASRSQLAWCPVEYRDDYRKIANNVPCREARAMIEELIAVDAARYAATGRLQQSTRSTA